MAAGRRTLVFIVCVVAQGTATGCQNDNGSTSTGVGKLPASGKLVSISPADDGQWTMAAKDYANTRYSSLDQITPANASKLALAWSYDTGSRNGHEGAPLVVGSTLYVITPFPNKLVALDLADKGAVKWTLEVPHEDAAKGVACCDLVNRGGAYADGKIYFATLDGHVVAADAVTGDKVFDVPLGQINQGETITMAPIVVDGKVLVGNSGGEFGVRGWLAALDGLTGKTLWQAYATGPDREVLIGPAFKPFYAGDRGTDLGSETWPGDAWKTGGGNAWGWISYDPTLDLIYYGTANPGPWNADMRLGDNKWTAGIFARKPATGEAVWFYQWSPHDLWDHDGINESILLDLVTPDARRNVLVHPERNGYVYVLDRTTGEVLSADPYVRVTASRGVDLKTGKLVVNTDKEVQPGRTSRDVCPFAPGAKDWEPSAFSPQTGLLYIPAITMCMDEEYAETSYIAGTPYVGANVRYYAADGAHRGSLIAWDPIARKPAWQIQESFPLFSGVVATAGGIVAYGTMDGKLKVVDAKTGQLAWSVQLPSGIVAQPITFKGPDGKQYLAVYSGVGGWAGSIVSLGLDPRDLSAANGWGNAMADLSSHTQKGGMLYVFALP